MRVLFFFVFIGSTLSGSRAPSGLTQGVIWFGRRAEGAIGTQAQVEPINKSIYHLQQAFEAAEGSQREYAGYYLLRAMYFKAQFALRLKEDKQRLFAEARKLAEGLIADYPKSARLRYMYVVCIGGWVLNHGVVESARQGLADISKEQAEKIIELDPGWRDGAGYLALGIVYFETPYIPFYITWPSYKKAAYYLKQAYDKSQNLHHTVRYAMALYETGETKRALHMLNAAVRMKPRPEFLLEDREYNSIARKQLREYTD